MNCLKNNITKKLLIRLKQFIIDEIKTSGMVMIADFLEKEKIIVKITKGTKRNKIFI